MKASSCLHNPDNFEIQKYAQYAAAKLTTTSPPTNTSDADTPEQAVRNLVSRVGDRTEFDYKEVRSNRIPDVTLLQTRHGYIGVCSHYADLTTGLLRSLNLPTRYVTAMFRKRNWPQSGGSYITGHAWTEVYLPTQSEWQQADSTWPIAFDKGIYERSGYIVDGAWADKYSLSSACPLWYPLCRCRSSCYQTPIDCADCRSKDVISQPLGDMSCVQNVQSQYHSTNVLARMQSTGEIGIHLQVSAFATRTVPLTLEVGLSNVTTASLSAITATLSISEYVDSVASLFDVTPAYQTITNLGPGQTISVTWVITPLVTGRYIPIQVAVDAGDLFEVAEQPLVVNEPGTLPDLYLIEGCGSYTARPGQPLTLTASVQGGILATHH